MKTFLAHPEGMHFHSKQDCRYVGPGYEQVTEAQVNQRRLNACPSCIITRLSDAQREQLECMGISPAERDKERRLILEWLEVAA